MVHHVVKIDFDTSFVGFGNQLVEILYVPQPGIYGGIVGYVISVIRHGRMDGRQPDGGYSQIREVVQFGGHSLEVSPFVTVAVGKGIDQQLITDIGT